MFDNAVATQAGIVIHRLIAAAVTDGLRATAIDALARTMRAAHPIGATTSWQTRR